jgi:dTDP-4-amino-4,6-dideoxygalactose transaminase
MSPSSDFIPFARPSIGLEEEAAVLRILRSGWLTTGAETLAFEQEFATYVGSPHALAVNSATSGLHLALEALGVGQGDKVITSPYTFTSTAAVVRHLSAEVLFCDTSPGSYNIDPAGLDHLLETNPSCKAVIPVHVAGLPCDMPVIVPLCRRHDCAVVEDAAHAFPVLTAAGYAGTLGDIGVYSFYATKTITTGEGGMVVCANHDLAARMTQMRMHGIDRAVWDRYTAQKAAWQYQVSEAGFKYNMPDILAAIGRVQLRRAEHFLAERRAIAGAYNTAFAAVPGLILPPAAGHHAWHLYTLGIDSTLAGISRDDMITALADAGIGASVHFIPLHIMHYYANRYSLLATDYPNAYATYQRSLSLPIWPGMGQPAIQRVIDTVLAAVRPERT